MKHIFAIVLALGLCSMAWGQSVGVVFSGGGAKGLYHVGILKALEENNIPIDYISGASMGAIVGGMYAAGYSPDEMIKFFITDSVQQWLSFKSASLDSSYYFKRFEPNGEMVSIRIDPRLRKSAAIQIPTNIISPYKIDLAFMEMMSGASAAAGGNFDSLMIPFRCNASDVYNKEIVVFDKGSLPFAMRASMTIPLVFKPLQYDTILLFDGGLYDNYPWQPLDTTFKPDIMIGGICAGNFENPSADNVVQQMTVMATQKTNYELPDSVDMTIKRRFPDVGTLDYNRAGYIIARGYEDAMRQMPIIKERIKRRVSDSEIAEKREGFKRKIKPLIFESIDIEGLNEKQTAYVLRQLGLSPHQIFDVSYFQRKYMQILSGGIFSGDFPEVTFNPETGHYRLKINMQTQASMKFSLGGNISSTSLNEGFVALSYQHVGRQVATYSVQGYFGMFYNAFQAGGRHDMYTQFPFYIDYSYSLDSYDFNTNMMRPYYKNQSWRYKTRTDNYVSSSIGVPVLRNSAFRGKVSVGIQNDDYFTYPNAITDRAENTRFAYGVLALEMQTQSLDHPLYANRGVDQLIQFRMVGGSENYNPGTLQEFGKSEFKGRGKFWGELRYKRIHYAPLSPWFSLGYHVEGVLSNHKSFENFIATAISSPTFAPTPMMSNLFMPEFRSASYIAAGIMPSFNIYKNNFYLNTYAYGFIPQEVVYDRGWKRDITGRLRNMTEFVFGATLVYQTIIGPASLSIAKYSTGPKNWQFAFNFGYTLFSPRKY